MRTWPAARHSIAVGCVLLVRGLWHPTRLVVVKVQAAWAGARSRPRAVAEPRPTLRASLIGTATPGWAPGRMQWLAPFPLVVSRRRHAGGPKRSEILTTPPGAPAPTGVIYLERGDLGVAILHLAACSGGLVQPPGRRRAWRSANRLPAGSQRAKSRFCFRRRFRTLAGSGCDRRTPAGWPIATSASCPRARLQAHRGCPGGRSRMTNWPVPEPADRRCLAGWCCRRPEQSSCWATVTRSCG